MPEAPPVVETGRAKKRRGGWALPFRVLVLPHSTFTLLAEREATAWPVAMGLFALAALAKGGVAVGLTWAGTIDARLLPYVAVRYAAALVGPLAFAAIAAGIVETLQRSWRGDAPFGRLLSAFSMALMPLALRDIAQAAYMAIRGRVLLHPGLSAIIAPPTARVLSRLEYSLLGQVDIFAVWVLALLILAMAASRGRRSALKPVIAILMALVATLVAAVPAYFIAPLLAR